MRLSDIAPNTQVTSDVPWYQKLLNLAPQVASVYLNFEQQRNLDKINLARAQNGQTAISAAEYQSGLQVGVNRSTQNTVLILAAGVGGVYLLTRLLDGGSSGRR